MHNSKPDVSLPDFTCITGRENLSITDERERLKPDLGDESLENKANPFRRRDIEALALPNNEKQARKGRHNMKHVDKVSHFGGS